MTYYPTLDEDLARAKEILAKGKQDDPYREEFLRRAPTEDDRKKFDDLFGGTIFGADIYAAYKLLESFVAEIEELRADYTEAVRLYRERDAQAARYHDRLQIDPGGSDRIDELEAAREHLRAELHAAQAEINQLRATLSDDPFDHNGECRYCDELGEHAEECVWQRARPR